MSDRRRPQHEQESLGRSEAADLSPILSTDKGVTLIGFPDTRKQRGEKGEETVGEGPAPADAPEEAVPARGATQEASEAEFIPVPEELAPLPLEPVGGDDLELEVAAPIEFLDRAEAASGFQPSPERERVPLHGDDVVTGELAPPSHFLEMAAEAQAAPPTPGEPAAGDGIEEAAPTEEWMLSPGASSDPDIEWEDAFAEVEELTSAEGASVDGPTPDAAAVPPAEGLVGNTLEGATFDPGPVPPAEGLQENIVDGAAFDPGPVPPAEGLQENAIDGAAFDPGPVPPAVGLQENAVDGAAIDPGPVPPAEGLQENLLEGATFDPGPVEPVVGLEPTALEGPAFEVAPEQPAMEAPPPSGPPSFETPWAEAPVEAPRVEAPVVEEVFLEPFQPEAVEAPSLEVTEDFDVVGAFGEGEELPGEDVELFFTAIDENFVAPGAEETVEAPLPEKQPESAEEVVEEAAAPSQADGDGSFAVTIDESGGEETAGAAAPAERADVFAPASDVTEEFTLSEPEVAEEAAPPAPAPAEDPFAAAARGGPVGEETPAFAAPADTADVFAPVTEELVAPEPEVAEEAAPTAPAPAEDPFAAAALGGPVAEETPAFGGPVDPADVFATVTEEIEPPDPARAAEAVAESPDIFATVTGELAAPESAFEETPMAAAPVEPSEAFVPASEALAAPEPEVEETPAAAPVEPSEAFAPVQEFARSEPEVEETPAAATPAQPAETFAPVSEALAASEPEVEAEAELPPPLPPPLPKAPTPPRIDEAARAAVHFLDGTAKRGVLQPGDSTRLDLETSQGPETIDGASVKVVFLMGEPLSPPEEASIRVQIGLVDGRNLVGHVDPAAVAELPPQGAFWLYPREGRGNVRKVLVYPWAIQRLNVG